MFFFYPLDFTFVCPTEITAFSDRIEEFKGINCEVSRSASPSQEDHTALSHCSGLGSCHGWCMQVIGCSVDSQFTHLAWTNTPRNKGGLGAMTYPLVADLTKSIAKDYEVLIEDGADAGVALR